MDRIGAPSCANTAVDQPRVTYQYLGPTQSTHQTAELTRDDAYRNIGANVVAGFNAVLHTTTAKGEPLTTRDGDLLKVVVLHGSRSAFAIFAFERAEFERSRRGVR